jgi:TonB-like protein
MQIRVQRFLVPVEPFYLGWFSSFAALCKSPDPSVSKCSPYLFRSNGVRRLEPPGKSKSLIGSVVLHVAAVFLLLQVADTRVSPLNTTEVNRLKVEDIYYYPLPKVEDPRPMPRIAPPGPGGKSGRGAQPEVDPKVGSSTFHKDFTVISNPIHPDNNQQTIIQPSSPPDLIIKQDLKLPNVMFGNPLAKPKAPLQFYANPVKPNEMAQTKVEDVAAPQTSVTDPSVKLTSLVAPSTSQPRLPVPLALTPGVAPAALAASARAAGGVAGEVNPGEPNGLLIMGTDPIAGGASIALPPGNKYGAFSISPAGGEPGSPGGVPGGGGGGTGELGTGGDESTGTGSARSGGGGGGLSSEAAPISVNVVAGIAGNHGNVEALLAAGTVFPVVSLPHVRKNALVISAGGVGGGGLGIYQALQCGRIYTIFLPMPTVNWTLQYCQQDDSQPKPNSSANSRIIQMETGLLPPDPVEEFDFRRVAVPADKAGKMIVLKGSIREDGFVDNLKVFQGVLKEMDEISLAAFSKWKFIPARRGGKPVAVQILVGIQLTSPAAH